MPTNRSNLTSYDTVVAEVLAASAAVFGRPVEAGDNFFDLGGDSLTAIELLIRLTSTLGVEPQVDDLVLASDLAAFARQLTTSAFPPAAGR